MKNKPSNYSGAQTACTEAIKAGEVPTIQSACCQHYGPKWRSKRRQDCNRLDSCTLQQWCNSKLKPGTLKPSLKKMWVNGINAGGQKKVSMDAVLYNYGRPNCNFHLTSWSLDCLSTAFHLLPFPLPIQLCFCCRGWADKEEGETIGKY